MPVLVAWIADMLVSTIGSIVVSALVSLGIGFATSHVASAVFDLSPVKAAMGSAGGLMQQYAGWLGIDQAMTIVFSAWMGRKVTDAARVSIVNRGTVAPKE